MSGQSGQRGYLIQTLICVLSALQDRGWVSLTLEPNLKSDKADIIWFSPNRTKVVQVKHSQNTISASKVKSWVKELEDSIPADEYELTLIGNCTKDVAQTSYGKVFVPQPLPLNIVSLIEQAAQKLDRYLESKGVSNVTPFARELIVEAFTTRLSTYSTQGAKLTREDVDKLLIEWTLVAYPNSLNKAASNLQLDYERRIENLRREIREQERVSVAKYTLKHEACLEALDAVDKILLAGGRDDLVKKFSNLPAPEALDIYQLGELARKCHNKLVIACDDPQVIMLFRTLCGLSGEKFTADTIVDLRVAIRKELGFGDLQVDADRNNAWIATVGIKINMNL